MKFLGFNLNVLHEPNSIDIEPLLELRSVDKNAIYWYTMTRVFDAPDKGKRDYLRVTTKAISHPNMETLMDPMLLSSVISMRDHIPSLVSFAPSIVDQNIWERKCNPSTSTNANQESTSNVATEVNLFTLVRDFTGYITIPTLMGSEFMELYPGVLEDTWDLGNGILYLMLGLPRWIPVRALTKAHIARARLLRSLRSFDKALHLFKTGDEPGFPWRDLSDVSQLVKDRAATWRANGVLPELYGPCDLSLLYG